MHRFCYSTSVPTDETTDSEIPEDQEDVLGSGPHATKDANSHWTLGTPKWKTYMKPGTQKIHAWPHTRILQGMACNFGFRLTFIIDNICLNNIMSLKYNLKQA